jgi:hypothetical protein
VKSAVYPLGVNVAGTIAVDLSLSCSEPSECSEVVEPLESSDFEVLEADGSEREPFDSLSLSDVDSDADSESEYEADSEADSDADSEVDSEAEYEMECDAECEAE